MNEEEEEEEEDVFILKFSQSKAIFHLQKVRSIGHTVKTEVINNGSLA